MFQNYFKIIVRNLWKNKLYTLINIVCLSFGIAAIVWAFQNYRFSFSWDNFHKDRENIFRVLTKEQRSDNLRGLCPMPVAAAARNDFSSVKQTVRWDSRPINIKADQNEAFATQVNFTDPQFLEVFNFPVVKGTVNLNDHSTVLITEQAAKKFFGDADPLGKTLMFYSDETYKKPLTVTAVLKDPPLNSSLRFEVITDFNNEYKMDGSIIKDDDWGYFPDAVFLKLSDPSEAARLSNDLKKYLPLEQRVRQDIKLTSFSLDPLTQVANHSRQIENNALMPRPDDAATYGPLVLAILILLSACLNFANTSVAQSNRRLKEMGIRKVMGSSLRQIMMQQLLECALIVLFAIALSVIINIYWLPAFNAMFVFVDVTANYFSDYTLLAFLAVILVSVTLLAGAYPAFYISRFNAANIFRGSVKFGGSNLFSRVLLGLQIVVSFITVIAGMAFFRNAEFQRTYDYGYDKENVIAINMQGASAYTPLRDEFNKIPGIDKIAATNDHIGFTYRRTPFSSVGKNIEAIYLGVGENYLELMKLKLAAGRLFNTSGRGDYERSMLINEKLAFEFGWKPEQAIGQQIRKDDTTLCTVVGVLKDFTQTTFFLPMEPVAMMLLDPAKYSQIIIRTKAGSLSSVYDQAKATWAKMYPLKPFIGYYQDEIAVESARVNENIAIIFFWFAVISVLMAATGMFALVSLTVLKRMKEIAIRKVIGASGGHIFNLVMKGYFWIFLLAAGLGCYAGYSLSKLLMDMIFRINSGVSTTSLIFSFICVLMITLVTIGSRVWHALRTRATDVLKVN
jgi:putative ABC transport system permease protein